MAALCATYAAGLAPTFALDPGLVRAEPWRLVTWPLAHASTAHLLWDALPLAILGALVEPRGRGRFAALVGASSLLPGLAWAALGTAPLAGASGWDSALFVVAALDLAGRSEAPGAARALGALAPLLFAAKVALELSRGGSLFLGGAGRGAAAVHLLSALVGASIWLLFWRVTRPLKASSP